MSHVLMITIQDVKLSYLIPFFVRYFVRYAPICPLEPNIATLIKLQNKFAY